MGGFICMPHIYVYKEVYIEIPCIGGPCPLKANGAPYQRIPKKLYPILDEFCALSKEEQAQYYQGGGCLPL